MPAADESGDAEVRFLDWRLEAEAELRLAEKVLGWAVDLDLVELSAAVVVRLAHLVGGDPQLDSAEVIVAFSILLPYAVPFDALDVSTWFSL